MHARNHAAGLWAVILATLVVAGCSSTGAPEGWLPAAQEAPLDPFGAWVTVEFVKTHDDRFLAGEFLAVDQDSLYVLTSVGEAVDPVVGVSLDAVKKAKIAHFDPKTENAAGWVTMGTLSTLSHGLGSIFSAPLWILLGSPLAGGHSRTPLENYPQQTWDELKKYARFPQGPPPGLHKLGLRPKQIMYSSPDAFPEPIPTDTLF